jgi:transposase InsO family protein
VPALADQVLYIGLESSFYRVLHAHGQVHRSGRARPPQQPTAVPRLRAAGPYQLWGWDITYLSITVRGICLYLCLVIDVWIRKLVAWYVADWEEAKIAADPACRQRQYHAGRHFEGPA